MLLALRRPKAVSAFHVKHGGVVESWGWQFEKCHFPHVLLKG
ncbi:hypothetical protein CORMATOL_00834 [Corynebacterium matruchotii ATCC 33806]|uniref:Uncharacterized protein n=1 Tax=Corynebacterium matruchotii ATCC 33806 TaxID=566549 RepID=C0E1I3_9CORY|nr:hypothetical protein CORMATOL_00834 [Corynebacterium matruchotii ATCC 33806]